MIVNIYTVHDSKAEAFLPPFHTKNDNMAKRLFADSIADKSQNIGRHPADYTLFRIGSYNDETAFLTQIPPESLGNGVEYVEPET